MARRVPVTAAAFHRHDYADAFEVGLRPGDGRTAEQLVRCALQESAPLLVRAVHLVQRRVLGLELAPVFSPDHLLGWAIALSRPDRVRIEARSAWLGRAAVELVREHGTATLTTTLAYDRPRPARAVWSVVGVLHRRVAVRLLDRAAARG